LENNYKTHAEMIREAIEKLGSAKPNSIMDYIRKKYPEVEIKKTSFRADIIGCSVNHSSSHHYPSMPKFLYYDKEKGTYNLYNIIEKEGLSGKITEHPLKIYEKLDPELLKHVENSSEFVFAEGAMPRKYKLLIGMAFDASFGAVQGVKSLALQALEAGATKEEITEALRVAHYLSGVGSIYTAGQALKELFDEE